MPYDAVGIILEKYGVDEETAQTIVRVAFKNGRMVYTEEEFEEYWIPQVFEKVLAERSDLNPELKDFNPEDDDIGLDLEGAEAAAGPAEGEVVVPEEGEVIPPELPVQ